MRDNLVWFPGAAGRKVPVYRHGKQELFFRLLQETIRGCPASLPMGVDPFWEQSCQAVPKATEPGPDGVRVAEKTFEIKDGQAIDVKISVDHDMVEVFVGEQVAFTYRIFRKPEYELGLLAQDAKVEFANIAIRK